VFHPGEQVELKMSSWFTLTEELDWTDGLPYGAVELPFRYEHLNAAVSAVERHDYAPNLLSVDPSDTGPPFRYRDVSAFARWAEHRRCGPGPGVLLAKALCGFSPDEHCCLAFTRDEWGDAIGLGAGLRTALATFCLAFGDVQSGTDLSVDLTIDIVWFIARSALVLRWLDYDRGSRLDSTNAFPVLPACRECVEMSTRRVAMGKGLSQDVVWTWRTLVADAIHDVEHDTPVNRLIRAELAAERAGLSPLPL
jgi:hypothetical protein